MSDADASLDALSPGPSQPADPRPAIAPAVLDGTTLYLSGQTAVRDGALVATGVVGAEVDLATARHCAEQCVHNLLAAAKAELGTLAPFAKLLHVRVYVASTPDFVEQHLVADAATDVLNRVLGLAPAARTAIGVPALPTGSPVEVDLVARVE